MDAAQLTRGPALLPLSHWTSQADHLPGCPWGAGPPAPEPPPAWRGGDGGGLPPQLTVQSCGCRHSQGRGDLASAGQLRPLVEVMERCGPCRHGRTPSFLPEPATRIHWAPAGGRHWPCPGEERRDRCHCVPEGFHVEPTRREVTGPANLPPLCIVCPKALLPALFSAPGISPPSPPGGQGSPQGLALRAQGQPLQLDRELPEAGGSGQRATLTENSFPPGLQKPAAGRAQLWMESCSRGQA